MDVVEPIADTDDSSEPHLPEVSRSSYLSEQADEPSTERRHHAARNMAIGTVAAIALAGAIALFTGDRAEAKSAPDEVPAASQSDGADSARTDQTNESDASNTKTDEPKLDNVAGDDDGSALRAIKKATEKMNKRNDKNDHGKPLTTQKIADELKYRSIKEAIKDDPYKVGEYLNIWMRDNGYGSNVGEYEVVDSKGGSTVEAAGTYYLSGYNEDGKFVNGLYEADPEGSGDAYINISPKTGKFCVEVSLGDGPHTKKDAKGNSIIKRFTYSADELMSAKNLSEYALKKFSQA